MIPQQGELARCTWPDGGCGRKILWTLTEAGKRQALDPGGDEAGSVAAYRARARSRYELALWPSRVITKAGAVPLGPQESRFKPHAETCPKVRAQAAAAAEARLAEIPGLLPGARVIRLDEARRRRNAAAANRPR